MVRQRSAKPLYAGSILAQASFPLFKGICPGGEMVDTEDLKSSALKRRASSSLAPGTHKYFLQHREFIKDSIYSDAKVIKFKQG